VKGLILGGGVTGLATGSASGLPVYEAASNPGGICSSYYVRPGQRERLHQPPADGEAYRFEIGGGHWIFGGDESVLALIEELAPVRRYERASSIFFPQESHFVPYPIQYHLRFMDPAIRDAALEEMAGEPGEITTMADWLENSFGTTLARLFFEPFHALYTAGLHTRIAPQDSFKSPVDIETARKGAQGCSPSVGYNTSYAYPADGLDALARVLADDCDIRYGKRAVAIDLDGKTVHFADDSVESYDRLVSTLPLDQTLAMAGIEVGVPPDPHTSVLVLNIGAERGPELSNDHWLYVPQSASGFHRVGCYSNVDRSFLPASARASGDRVSLYIERAYTDAEPEPAEVERYSRAVVRELQQWGFIGEAEVVDPTWIDVAYTWRWPGSDWRELAMAALEARDILPVGRYARWVFQGIADSIRDGLAAGAELR
jgi:protoporphyrinogen oxidase